jgi:UDP-hydrolysing UDP-N-acetyl-D-glucosamine 2-epimerase
MGQSARAISVVTGSRAEFGLLKPVMRAIAEHPDLALHTIVTGTHLSADTKQDITAAGFAIDAEAPMQQPNDTGRAAETQALARGIGEIGQALERLKPAFVLVLGDRIEAYAAASAAHVAGYRLAHVHGGDRAEGIADEALRHAISKLAHVHCPASAASRRRLTRMGEPPAQVYRVGSPAIDDLSAIEPATDAPAAIVLQHPIGEDEAQERQWMEATLHATAPYSRLVLMPNHDAGRAGIVQAIEAANVDAIEHVPRSRFVALLKGARVIVGNSSAGLIEAAAVKTACVNVGPRQAGREKPGQVVDCDYGEAPVAGALEQALNLDLRRLRHPYGKGDAGRRIADTLAGLDLAALPLRKRNAY